MDKLECTEEFVVYDASKQNLYLGLVSYGTRLLMSLIVVAYLYATRSRRSFPFFVVL